MGLSSAASRPVTGSRPPPAGTRLQGRLWRILWEVLLPPPETSRRTVPTTSGIMLFLLATAIAGAAYLNADNILFMTLSLLLSSFLMSVLLSRINFRQLDWSLRSPPYLRAGEQATFRIEVTNRKKHLPSYTIQFRIEAPGADGETLHSLPARIDPGTTRAADWVWHPPHRGKHHVNLRSFESRFPLGFLRRRIHCHTDAELLAWPAQLLCEFRPHQPGLSRQEGNARQLAGSGSDLINIRNYQSGDSQRLVHWKASARMQKLMVRQLGEERESLFDIQFSLSQRIWLTGESFETACSAAATLADYLFREGRLNRVRIGNQPWVFIRTHQDLYHYFDDLALIQREKEESAPEPPSSRCVTLIPGGPGKVEFRCNGRYAGYCEKESTAPDRPTPKS